MEFTQTDLSRPLTFGQLVHDEVFEFLHRFNSGTGLGPWRKIGPCSYTRASGPYKPGGMIFKFQVDTTDAKVIRQERP